MYNLNNSDLDLLAHIEIILREQNINEDANDLALFTNRLRYLLAEEEPNESISYKDLTATYNLHVKQRELTLQELNTNLKFNNECKIRELTKNLDDTNKILDTINNHQVSIERSKLDNIKIGSF